MHNKIRFCIRRLRLLVLHLLGKDLMILPTRKEMIVEFGNASYGQWGVAKEYLDKDSVILSFGIGMDASFDMDIIEILGAKVHGFDPTPKSIDWVYANIKNESFIFHEYGVADYEGSMRLHLPLNDEHVSAACIKNAMSGDSYTDAPVCDLLTISKRLDLDRIDYLKMDIEGAEYSVLPSLRSLPQNLLPMQLAVEFHHFFSNYSNQDTLRSISLMEELGYHIVWSSASCKELLFLHTSASRFSG